MVYGEKRHQKNDSLTIDPNDDHQYCIIVIGNKYNNVPFIDCSGKFKKHLPWKQHGINNME